MTDILEEFKILVYGLEVWQDPTLLRNSLKRYNELQEQIQHAIKLQQEVKQQIKVDNDFMYAKDPELKGTYSASIRRGILETLWSKAK